MTIPAGVDECSLPVEMLPEAATLKRFQNPGSKREIPVFMRSRKRDLSFLSRSDLWLADKVAVQECGDIRESPLRSVKSVISYTPSLAVDESVPMVSPGLILQSSLVMAIIS